jgi:hypothetical protein
VRTGIPRTRWYGLACAVLTKSSGSTGGSASTPDLWKGGVCLSAPRFSWVLGLVCSVSSGCFTLQRAVRSFGIDIWVHNFRDQSVPLNYDRECAFRSQNVVPGKSTFQQHPMYRKGLSRVELSH